MSVFSKPVHMAEVGEPMKDACLSFSTASHLSLITVSAFSQNPGRSDDWPVLSCPAPHLRLQCLLMERGWHPALLRASQSMGVLVRVSAFSGNIGIACVFSLPAHRGPVSISSSGRSPQDVSYQLNGVCFYLLSFFFLQLSI